MFETLKHKLSVLLNKKLEPNYRVIELEAENNHLKDELIEELKDKIRVMKAQMEMFTNDLLLGKSVEEDYGPISNLQVKARPRLLTMSEVARTLELNSLKRKGKADEIEKPK